MIALSQDSVAGFFFGVGVSYFAGYIWHAAKEERAKEARGPVTYGIEYRLDVKNERAKKDQGRG